MRRRLRRFQEGGRAPGDDLDAQTSEGKTLRTRASLTQGWPPRGASSPVEVQQRGYCPSGRPGQIAWIRGRTTGSEQRPGRPDVELGPGDDEGIELVGGEEKTAAPPRTDRTMCRAGAQRPDLRRAASSTRASGAGWLWRPAAGSGSEGGSWLRASSRDELRDDPVDVARALDHDDVAGPDDFRAGPGCRSCRARNGRPCGRIGGPLRKAPGRRRPGWASRRPGRSRSGPGRRPG